MEEFRIEAWKVITVRSNYVRCVTMRVRLIKEDRCLDLICCQPEGLTARVPSQSVDCFA